MSEFQEIAHSGGRIELHFEEPNSVSLGFSSTGNSGMSLFQVGISMDGKKLEYWPLRGLDMRGYISSPESKDCCLQQRYSKITHAFEKSRPKPLSGI